MSNNMIANRYEVFQHIGQGGMADVFLAIDTILNRQVAIKILRSELSTDAVSVVRFEREAQAAATLSHPNIVEIYDVGEYRGHHFIVMEYVPGRTLKKIIHDRGSLLTEEAIEIEKQLVSATGEAHQRGIIHRDIKPQNVIVKSDGSIKILDFGIALAKGSVQLTEAKNVMGSVHYLAPELAKGEPASVQSDVYALGIVLFEMLSGDVPFNGESAIQVALKQMREELPDIQTINPMIPHSIANIIARATAKDPKQRYRSCSEMLEDLRTCLYPERRNERRLVIGKQAVSRGGTGFDTEPEEILRKNHGDVHKTKKKKKRRKSRLTNFFTGLLIILLFILGGAGAYFTLNSLGLLHDAGRTVAVPDLIGYSLTEANDICKENDLVLDKSNVSYTLTEETKKGKIIDVSPGIGTEVERGSRINVTVSSGVYAVADDFTGMNISEVQDLINDESNPEHYKYANLSLQIVEEEVEGAVPGTVIRQELLDPGTQYNPDIKTEVKLIVVSYVAITIPEDIEGKTIDEAERILTDMGAVVFTSPQDTSSLSEEEKENLIHGVVIKCEPAAGSQYIQRDGNYIILFYY